MKKRTAYTIIQARSGSAIDAVVVDAFKHSPALHAQTELGQNKYKDVISLTVPTNLLKDMLTIEKGLRTVISGFNLELTDVIPEKLTPLKLIHPRIRVANPMDGATYVNATVKNEKTAYFSPRPASEIKERLERIIPWLPAPILLGLIGYTIYIGGMLAKVSVTNMENVAEQNNTAMKIELSGPDGLDAVLDKRSGIKKRPTSAPANFQTAEDERRENPDNSERTPGG